MQAQDWRLLLLTKNYFEAEFLRKLRRDFQAGLQAGPGQPGRCEQLRWLRSWNAWKAGNHLKTSWKPFMSFMPFMSLRISSNDIVIKLHYMSLWEPLKAELKLAPVNFWQKATNSLQHYARIAMPFRNVFNSAIRKGGRGRTVVENAPHWQ